MGTWGVAIFSDDVACDVRDEYRALVAEGLSGANATQRVLQEYQEVFEDMDVSPVFWLALAVTQWRCGRLEEGVKTKALEVIESGVDLARWSENPGLLPKRKAVLEKAKLQITSPQPLPKKIRKPYKQQTLFEIGDAFTYQLASGNYVIFRVVDLHGDKGGVAPCVELCDWSGKLLPPGGKIQSLKARRPLKVYMGGLILLFQRRDSDFPASRIQLVSKGLKVSRDKRTATVVFWPDLDRLLKEGYGFE